jgi:hypothetical protein
MPVDYIRYDLLVQEALRSVVRKVLTDASRGGLPGEHHFNISFKTQGPGVVIPAVMKQRYPEEMAIILQHEFWDLVVGADGFEVSLNFSRKPERLTIPFDAITGFSDPSVPFGFKLEAREVGDAKATPSVAKATLPTPKPPAPTSLIAPKTSPTAVAATISPRGALATKPAVKTTQAPTGPRSVDPPAKTAEKQVEKPRESDPAKVVSIDAFRKK